MEDLGEALKDYLRSGKNHAKKEFNILVRNKNHINWIKFKPVKGHISQIRVKMHYYNQYTKKFKISGQSLATYKKRIKSLRSRGIVVKKDYKLEDELVIALKQFLEGNPNTFRMIRKNKNEFYKIIANYKENKLEFKVKFGWLKSKKFEVDRSFELMGKLEALRNTIGKRKVIVNYDVGNSLKRYLKSKFSPGGNDFNELIDQLREAKGEIWRTKKEQGNKLVIKLETNNIHKRKVFSVKGKNSINKVSDLLKKMSNKGIHVKRERSD